MELSKLFMIGASGYIMSGLYDLAILTGKPLLARPLHALMFVTAVPYPFLFINHRSPLPPGVAWIILPALSILAALLIYSVFIEIPLASDRPGQLFQGGTYRISRHPGFLWYTGINILVALYFMDAGIAALCAGLTACNLLLITIEDLILFPKMFEEYETYKKHTPFLFSISRPWHHRSHP